MWPNVTTNESYYYNACPLSGETYFNSKTVDAKKMDRVLRLFDYFAGDKGQIDAKCGLEGVDFTNDGGTLTLIPTKDSSGNTMSAQQKYPSTSLFKALEKWGGDDRFQNNPLNIQNFGQDLYDYQVNQLNNIKSNGKPAPFDLALQTIHTPAMDNKGPQGTELQDDIIKIIVGSDDVAKAWQACMDKYNKKGLHVIDEFNAEATKQGK